MARTKNFLCTTCGYSCISKYKLQLHERTHTDERVKKKSSYLFYHNLKDFIFSMKLNSRLNAAFATKDFGMSALLSAIYGSFIPG